MRTRMLTFTPMLTCAHAWTRTPHSHIGARFTQVYRLIRAFLVDHKSPRKQRQAPKPKVQAGLEGGKGAAEEGAGLQAVQGMMRKLKM